MGDMELPVGRDQPIGIAVKGALERENVEVRLNHSIVRTWRSKTRTIKLVAGETIPKGAAVALYENNTSIAVNADTTLSDRMARKGEESYRKRKERSYLKDPEYQKEQEQIRKQIRADRITKEKEELWEEFSKT